MKTPLTDSWDQDRHHSLKRWERGAQRAAWMQRGAESTAPPLPCPWRASPEDSLTLRPAHVLAMFSSDLTVARFSGVPEGAGGIRVLRGGIPWDHWAPVLLNAYLAAAPVPEPFRPRLRLPPAWLTRMLAGSPEEQRLFFAKLREGGALSPLRKITAESVAPWLRWDEMRARLMDFKEK